MNVKAALVAAVQPLQEISITDFTTYPQLCEFESYTPDGRAMIVKPDAFIRVMNATPKVGCASTPFFWKLIEAPRLRMFSTPVPLVTWTITEAAATPPSDHRGST